MLLYIVLSNVTNPTISNSPLVRVPVLSVNSIFRLPLLSIPTNFLTRTFSFSSLFILLDNTKVIIIGNPSGTATTIMVIPRVRLYNK